MLVAGIFGLIASMLGAETIKAICVKSLIGSKFTFL